MGGCRRATGGASIGASPAGTPSWGWTACRWWSTPRGLAAADMHRLLEINKELNRHLPVEALLAEILTRAVALTGAERGFVLLRGDEGLSVAASHDAGDERELEQAGHFSRSIAQAATERQAPVVAADAMSDERFAEQLSIAGLRLRAVLCVPLEVGGTVRGALYVDNRFRVDAFHRGHVRPDAGLRRSGCAGAAQRAAARRRDPPPRGAGRGQGRGRAAQQPAAGQGRRPVRRVEPDRRAAARPGGGAGASLQRDQPDRPLQADARALPSSSIA